ncbi:hypothetical protein B0J17DRAFT_675349 [Rhizoctonia solani]|nr:hypothetical protein B0J17DRAFT_675349 [Rhizoctonia solani]
MCNVSFGTIFITPLLPYLRALVRGILKPCYSHYTRPANNSRSHNEVGTSMAWNRQPRPAAV